MAKIIAALFFGGIYLLVAGGYDAFIQFGARTNPTKITVAELEKRVPWNRHLLITDGRPVPDGGVYYYQTRRYQKVKDSEIYFIPIQDAKLTAYRSLTPTLLLRMTEAQMTGLRNGQALGLEGIQGIRMTGWDLKDEAEDLLAKEYGKAAVGKMVVIDYEKKVTGVWPGLGKMVGGVGCMVGSLVVAGAANRRKG